MGGGTALSAADIGNGIDTIRPVKRVDAAGSLRMSAEFVGAAGSGSFRGVPPGAEGELASMLGTTGESREGQKKGERRRTASEAGRAGKAWWTM